MAFRSLAGCEGPRVLGRTTSGPGRGNGRRAGRHRIGYGLYYLGVGEYLLTSGLGVRNCFVLLLLL